jgi:PPK2 family polyphosphate:nucleotide phosphotransferase
MASKHRFDQKRFLVSPNSNLTLSKVPTAAGKELRDKRFAAEALAADVEVLRQAQEKLYAGNRHAVLVILQGMDASGKDGAISHVMRGVNPLGCRAYAFKAPNETEVQHHFLWRPTLHLPERGMMSIFNRSYYEEVLAVRVHPQYLEPQRLPNLKSSKPKQLAKLWKQRFREINSWERTLVECGTIIVKFHLHISLPEQKQRLLERLRDPNKHWKFNARDLEERKLWDEYQVAYEDMLKSTSTEWAPWHIIPADDKWYARAAIADILAARMEDLGVAFPEVSTEQQALYQEMARELAGE